MKPIPPTWPVELMLTMSAAVALLLLVAILVTLWLT